MNLGGLTTGSGWKPHARISAVSDGGSVAPAPDDSLLNCISPLEAGISAPARHIVCHMRPNVKQVKNGPSAAPESFAANWAAIRRPRTYQPSPHECVGRP